VSCAQRGNPTGGPKDITPPKTVRVSPPNYSVNFENQEIRIRFDEYIKFKDLQKQLVISPPLDNRPVITPQGGVAREIRIQIQDTLKENTTYVLNFGQSVVDNNEENAFPYLKYVFSTGPVIDSLTLNGRVSNAFEFKTDDFVNVLLYEVTETYTDSAIYNLPPDYVLNTLDSLSTFTLENLRAGQYRMIALKEKSTNLRFDPLSDKIGFVNGVISVPDSTIYDLRIYDPVPPAEVKRAFQVSPHRIDIGFVGARDSVDIIPFNQNDILESRFTKFEKKDTLNYWFKAREGLDSLLMLARYRGIEDTLKIKFKQLAKDTLKLSQYGQFSLREPVAFQASTLLTNLDESKFMLIDRDSATMSFDIQLDSLRNVFEVNFEKQESQRYTLTMFPGAVEDFLGNKTADTLSFNYSTKKIIELANIFVTLEKGENFPVLVQVLDASSKKVIAEKRAASNEEVAFNFLDPGTFQLRVIYDTNDNGKYDPGNFLLGIQPERVQYSAEFPVQANWDDMRTINLE
jgi:hypothetical protein